MPALPTILVLLAPTLSSDVHVDSRRGFRIEVPEEWTTEEQTGGSEVGFTLTLRPPEVERGIAVRLEITPDDGGATVGERYALDLARVRGGERISKLEEYELEIAGRSAPSVRFDYATTAATYRIHRSHLVHAGSSWVLQRNAPVEVYGEWAPTFDRVVASFELVELSAEGARERRLAELAARCGSEVDWAPDWEAAAARAREEKKPVLVVAWLLASFTGASTARHGLLTDPDVIELLNERFVPLWYQRGMTGALFDRYGVSATAFGKALIAATPDGEPVFETHELDSATVAHQFLRERLARHPELAGTPVPEEGAAIERAERHAARGELHRAVDLLEGDASARAHRLRARILRLRRNGEGALAALAGAREAGGAPEGALLVEEARVCAHLGETDEARARLERVRSEHPGCAEVPEALYRLSLLDLRAGNVGRARRRWRTLVDGHSENRFAWQAAQMLRRDAVGSAYPPSLVWPEEEAVAEVVAPRDPAPLEAGAAEAALDEALSWLLASQQPDGSWVSPTEVHGGQREGPEPFVDSITALAGRAVLSHAERDGGEAAARAALRFVLDSIASRERTPPFTFVMDYTTWSDACMLAFLADARAARLAGVPELRGAVASLLEDLRARRQEGGGWTYLVTGDPASGRPPSHSMSFVTGGVLRALCRARDAGFAVPEDLIDDAAACLERMRNEDGGFEYRRVHSREDTPRETPLAGAAGRGPVCELALLGAGRGSAERLDAAVEIFLEHSGLYVAETGKALAHAGSYIIGCHYLYFDCEGAAGALARLEGSPGRRVRLREMILAGRLADGSFLDNPVVGRSYATAQAVLALDQLRES